jgi:hypothetical protein
MMGQAADDPTGKHFTGIKQIIARVGAMALDVVGLTLSVNGDPIHEGHADFEALHGLERRCVSKLQEAKQVVVVDIGFAPGAEP